MRTDFFYFFSIDSSGLSYLRPVTYSLGNLFENLVCGSYSKPVGYFQQVFASDVFELAIYRHQVLMHIGPLRIIGVRDVVGG